MQDDTNVSPTKSSLLRIVCVFIGVLLLAFKNQKHEGFRRDLVNVSPFY